MPNGRSGGFILQTSDLKKMLKTISGATLVGYLIIQNSINREASASDASAFVDECTQVRLAVEEQHHDSYIIHLSREIFRVLMVGSKSPLFPELRQRHAHWVAEHPDWNDWIAF